MNPFADELAALLNKYGCDTVAGTPDFILATYLIACLGAFGKAAEARDEWLSPPSVDPAPPESRLVAKHDTIPEFAALCRERCDRPAQGHEELRCGESYLTDNDTAYSFCGRHWVTVFGALEDR